MMSEEAEVFQIEFVESADSTANKNHFNFDVDFIMQFLCHRLAGQNQVS